jgi:hypothetical protein
VWSPVLQPGIESDPGQDHDGCVKNDVVASTASVVYHMGGFDRRLTKLSGKCQPDLYDNKRVIDPLTKLDLFSVNLPKFPLRERGLRKKGSLLSTGA